MKILNIFLFGAIYADHLPTVTFNGKTTGLTQIGCDTGRIRVVKVFYKIRSRDFLETDGQSALRRITGRSSLDPRLGPKFILFLGNLEESRSIVLE